MWRVTVLRARWRASFILKGKKVHALKFEVQG